MTQQITPFSAAQSLLSYELFSFTSRTFSALFGLDKFQTNNLLNRMEKEGLATRIERGKFLLLGLTPEKVLSDPLYIGSYIVTPAYVSFWSGLHFYGFTEQVPRTVFVVTTRRKKDVNFREMHFQFMTLKPQHFFGYRWEMLADLPIVIADEAKSILESLALPQYAGGLAEVAKALQIATSEERLEMQILSDVIYVQRCNPAIVQDMETDQYAVGRL